MTDEPKTNEPREAPPQRIAYGLTDDELSVVSLIAGGLADQEIALELVVSAGAVDEHLTNILRKMDAKSRTEVAIRALKEGFADPPGSTM